MVHNHENIDLSVIVPVYNIDNIVNISLEKIFKALDLTELVYEVIVVNDGSTDDTVKTLKKITDHKSVLKIITYEKNKGKGYAVRNGITQSTGKWVMFLDGDLDISTDMIIEYLNELKNYDLVIGSKRHHASKLNIALSRKLLSKLFSIVVHLSTDLKIRDTQVGLKVGDGILLRYIFSMMKINGFAFDVEFLVIASLLNMKIKEMPIKMNLRRRFIISYILQMFRDILIISYRYKISHYYQCVIHNKSLNTNKL